MNGYAARNGTPPASDEAFPGTISGFSGKHRHKKNAKRTTARSFSESCLKLDSSGWAAEVSGMGDTTQLGVYRNELEFQAQAGRNGIDQTIWCV